jgi:hypothetical protein
MGHDKNASDGEELERQAVALVKQYGWALPPPAKAFFRRLADYLNWKTLQGAMK